MVFLELTLLTAQANEKNTKINLWSHSTSALFHQPVPLYIPGQHKHIAILLNGTMLGVVVLVEGLKKCGTQPWQELEEHLQKKKIIIITVRGQGF